MDEILKRLQRLEQLILEQNIIQKEVLNLPEAAKYTGQSHSHLYKLTSDGKIPFYKPTGKKLYFKREELDKWLLRNRNCSQDEIDQMTADFQIKNGGRHGTN